MASDPGISPGEAADRSLPLAPITVAVDGLGVEAGPGALAAGARLAAADGIRLRIFGPTAEIDLAGVAGCEVFDTTEVITNHESPVAAVRHRPEASVVRTVADVAAGHSDAVVSMGSTGAAMAAATFGLKRLRGVKRPALSVRLPLPGREVLFLDVGANVDLRAQHLVQFAWLGAAFARSAMAIPDPTVALLSVGEEAGKGRDMVVEANAALSGAERMNFIGNVEGRDIPAGGADVIVTDGFTGNIALKTLEGTAGVVAGAISSAARSNPLSALGGLLMKPALRGLRKEMKPDSTGGAIMLGLRRVAVVGHGNSGPEGIANAIRVAAGAVSAEVPARTEELLHEGGAERKAIDGIV